MSDVGLQTDYTQTLFTGALTGNLDSIEEALSRGVDVNTVDEGTGLSALHSAIGRNHLDAVKLLLERGAAVVPDRRGRWPSTIAELCEADGEICDLIVDAESALGIV